MAGKTLSNGVVFVPGEFFYCNEPDHTTLRMSFVTPTDEQLKEAVRRLKISPADAHNGRCRYALFPCRVKLLRGVGEGAVKCIAVWRLCDFMDPTNFPLAQRGKHIHL